MTDKTGLLVMSLFEVSLERWDVQFIRHVS